MMLCLQFGSAQKWFCLTVSASIYRKSTFQYYQMLLTYGTAAPNLVKKIWPDLPKSAGPAGAGGEIRYIPNLKSSVKYLINPFQLLH